MTNTNYLSHVNDSNINRKARGLEKVFDNSNSILLH